MQGDDKAHDGPSSGIVELADAERKAGVVDQQTVEAAAAARPDGGRSKTLKNVVDELADARERSEDLGRKIDEAEVKHLPRVDRADDGAT